MNKSFNRGVSAIGIIISLIIIVVIAGGIYFYLSSKSSSVVPNTVPNENSNELNTTNSNSSSNQSSLAETSSTPKEEQSKTAGWKNFRSEEYDYEVKYPADWTNYGELWGGFNITSPVLDGHADNRIVVSVIDREGNESNSNYINNHIKRNTLSGYMELNKKEEITINGTKGYKIIWNELNSDTGQMEEDTPMIYLETPSNNKAQFIILQIQGRGSQYQTNLATFNLMLSTFKFIK